MKRNLFNVGIGGFGSKLASEVTRKMRDNGVSVTCFAVDTDYCELDEMSCDYKLDLSLPEKFSNTLERLEAENVRIFSEDISTLGYVKTLPMDKGANSWRIKAMASFIAYMSDVENKKTFYEFLDGFSFSADDTYSFSIFSSLAGGTGSALFIPLALYIKRFLKEKGCNKLEFTFYGACPDIFVEGLNLELKTKAYANAYASLNELNTLNSVALRKAESNVLIGYENSSIGVLFDGKDKGFHTKESMPFNKAYLFDRMPGIFSAELHLNLLADYVYYINEGLTSDTATKNCAMLKAFSACEIALDTEDIIDYVAKYFVERDIKKEMLKPFFEIEKTEGVYSAKKELNDEVGEYSRKIRTYLENLDAGKDEKTAFVLDRLEDDDRPLTIDDDYWLAKYGERLSNAFEERLYNGEYTSLCAELTVDNEEKKPKKTRLEELKNKIDKLYTKLNDYYFSSEKAQLSEDYQKLFLENEDWSIIENALKEGEHFIHPTLAFIRLGKLYSYLKKRAKICSRLKEEEIERAKEPAVIPEKLLILDNPNMEASGYGSLSTDRFLRIIAKREKPVDIKKLSAKEKRAYLKEKKKYVLKNPTDEKVIYSDFKGVLEAIIGERKGYYFNALKEFVGLLIQGYKKLYKELLLVKHRIESETELSKKERVSQGVYYGVMTGQEDRERAVKICNDELLSSGRFEGDNDLGKRVLEYLLKSVNKLKTEDIKPVEDLIDVFVGDVKKRIKKTGFYKDIESKNVFSAMIEPISNGYDKTYLKTALMIKPNLLTFNQREETEIKTLFVSRDTAEYVLSLKDELCLRATTPEEAIDEFLTNIGEYETQIKILDGLSNKRAYAVAERGGIKISNLSKMNGEMDISIYKNHYQKALENVDKFQTPMWNPHLFDLGSGTELVELK